MSYIMMEQITTEKRDILLAIQGTNVWSGQTLQSHNSAVCYKFEDSTQSTNSRRR
jgi:hypothetical protein